MEESGLKVSQSGDFLTDTPKVRLIMAKSMKGQFNHNIDAKGRLIVPSKLRDQLGGSFVVTKGLDDCLYAYPEDEWEKFSDKLNSLPIANKNARQFKRFFQAGATDCEIDSQGRILLPQILREFAGINKEVVIIGNGEKAEIWSKERWDDNTSDEALDMDEIATQMDQMFSI